MALPPRSAATTLTALAVLAALSLTGGPAHADGTDPSAPPGSVTTSPPPPSTPPAPA